MWFPLQENFPVENAQAKMISTKSEQDENSTKNKSLNISGEANKQLHTPDTEITIKSHFISSCRIGCFLSFAIFVCHLDQFIACVSKYNKVLLHSTQ